MIDIFPHSNPMF